MADLQSRAQVCRHFVRRCRRLFPADGRRRGRHAGGAQSGAPRSRRSEYRRAQGPHRAHDGRRPAGRIQQRRRCRALRDRDPTGNAGAECRYAGRPAASVSLRDQYGRCRLGRRSDLRRWRRDRFADGGLAEPGGINVSRAVRDQVRDRLPIIFEDCGEHEVKNITRPVRVFRVLLEESSTAAGHRPPQSRRAGRAARRSPCCRFKTSEAMPRPSSFSTASPRI